MTLKGIRSNTGMTLAQVAAELELSERQVRRLEDGTTPGKRLHWLALSVVYGVPVAAVEKAARETVKTKGASQ